MRIGKTLPAGLTAVALALAIPAVAVPTMARAGEADDAVLAEVNFARTHPQAYARRLMLQPVSDWERALGPDARRLLHGEQAAVALLQREAAAHLGLQLGARGGVFAGEEVEAGAGGQGEGGRGAGQAGQQHAAAREKGGGTGGERHGRFDCAARARFPAKRRIREGTRSPLVVQR